MKVKEEGEKASLKLNIQKKNKDHGSQFHQSWQIDRDSFPGGSEVKASASNAEDPGLIPGSGRSPGEGNGNPLQYSCLENPMDREAW